jgi:hypothetical protein
MENIFSTLHKYKPQPNMTPTENFFTESFKFILNLDESFCNIFIKKIAPDKKFIGPYNIESQKKYGDSTIDLQISDKRGQKILIEIKISAKENRYLEEDEKNYYGQIEKYLRLNNGYVCFIAREEGDVKIKNNKDKYLGQFEWFEIYQLISDYIKSHKLNGVKKIFINNFLNFMKEMDMSPFEGFDKKDIKLSRNNFLDFEGKLNDFLKKIYKDNRIQAFCKKHKLSAAVSTPKRLWNSYILILVKSDWVYWKKRIAIGFSFYTPQKNDKKKEGIYYFQEVELGTKSYEEKFINHLKQIKISDKYFEKYFDSDSIPFYKEIYFPEFAKKSEKQITDDIYKSLLELEKCGIIGMLEKVK